ncbi:MAG TPA: YeeE/YedE thiosulfate transporter family protein [Burkholderiales bacterium]|nr:YeeE/YedE thiosulfate transporter family protein [Burkholderiales bacterium]
MSNFTPVPALIGGVLIGLASVWLLAANGRIAGVSGILHGLFVQPPGDRMWRAAFVAGLIAAGFIWHLFSSSPSSSPVSLPLLATAGALVGFGTRMGGGCTSGHGVCGLGRFSLRSLVAVIVFMAAGMAATYMVRHVL